MSRTTKEWLQRPDLPASHYVHPAIYSDPAIFRDEQERIFRRVWHLACHESELPKAGDFRTYRHPGGTRLVLVRGADGKIRSFYNVCPHRGNLIAYDPAGNTKHLVCIFHQWAFNGYGECVDIPRCKAGYQDRVRKSDVSLKEVRSEVAYGGFVWVNLDDDCESLADYIGPALDSMLPELEAEPLEVFWYYQATLETNYKLIHDTNSEFYHDFLHVYNRVTGMLDPKSGYYQRRYTAFPNGHCAVGSQTCNYGAYQASGRSELGWPNLAPRGWKMVDLFPAI